MWRIALFITLLSSIVLNVYFFLQLSIRVTETTLQQDLNVHSHQRSTRMQLDEVTTKDNENNKSAQQIVENIKKVIDDKDFFNANFLIHKIANDHQAELSDVRLFWLKSTKSLIQQKFYAHAEDSINAYLAFQNDDIDFLYQQVDLYWQQQLPLLAIKHSYEVQYHLFNRSEVHEAVNTARKLVQQQVDVLIKNNHWLELRNLIEEVLLFDANSINLKWILARAQYQLGEFEYAQNTIEAFLNEPDYKIKARALLADIEAGLRKPQSIPLSRQGEHFIVQGQMNNTFNVSLMLDTGASISLLSESAFEELSEYSDVVYIKDLNLNTAGGTVTASIYQVAEFSIQNYVVNDFIFAVSPYTSEYNDGLLGMNFLKAFDFHIDQNNGLLILKNK